MQVLGSDVLEWNSAIDRGWEELRNGNPTLGMLIVTGLNFGLRISDLLTVTWEDLRSREFIVNEKKTSKKRKVVVNQNVQDAYWVFVDRVGKEGTGPVFTSQKGTVVSPQHVNRMLKKIFHKGISSHGLRKTFGRRLYEKSGKDLALVQLRLNHSDPKHTLRYIGVTEEKLDACYDMIL